MPVKRGRAPRAGATVAPMSLMFMVAAALGLLLAAIAVALVWSVMRGGVEERARAAAGDAPRLGDVVVFLRFDGAAARDAEALVSARAASAAPHGARRGPRRR